MELKETHQYRYGNIFNTFEPWVHPHTSSGSRQKSMELKETHQFRWIQMRYGVNPWLKLIENITVAILTSFLEFHGLLAISR